MFDKYTLPAGLRREHRTRARVWGITRVLEGRLYYRVLDPISQAILDLDHPGFVSVVAGWRVNARTQV